MELQHKAIAVTELPVPEEAEPAAMELPVPVVVGNVVTELPVVEANRLRILVALAATKS